MTANARPHEPATSAPAWAARGPEHGAPWTTVGHLTDGPTTIAFAPAGTPPPRVMPLHPGIDLDQGTDARGRARGFVVDALIVPTPQASTRTRTAPEHAARRAAWRALRFAAMRVLTVRRARRARHRSA